MSEKQWTKSVASQWGLFLPPARPSLSELAIIEKIILQLKSSKKNKFKMAILGSTPEYRDLGQQYDVDYKCIEYNANNFGELGQFTLHKNDSKKVIVSDWRTMNFNETFDLFIGDLATTVTPVADHEEIFRNIKAHCNKGARIILKTPLRQNNKQLSHKEIFELYRKKYFYLNPFAGVWHEVLLADYDFDSDTMNCQTSLASLKKSHEKGIVNDFEFSEFEKRWNVLGDFKMNVPLQKEFVKKISKYFAVKENSSGQDWYKKWARLLILQNK